MSFASFKLRFILGCCFSYFSSSFFTSCQNNITKKQSQLHKPFSLPISLNKYYVSVVSTLIPRLPHQDAKTLRIIDFKIDYFVSSCLCGEKENGLS